MKWFTRTSTVAFLAAGSLFGATQTADAQHVDIEVGRTSGGQVAIEADLDEAILLEAVDGLLRGWTESDPGFFALEADEPDEDLFLLETGADISLEIVSIDEGLKFWASGLGSLADEIGEIVPLGDESLHTHLTFHIDSDVVGSDFMGTLEAQIKLIDQGSTGYADSDPVTMRFTNFVPEPATAGVVMATGAFLLLVRRREA